MNVSIIIPAFNEQKGIAVTLDTLQNMLNQHHIKGEIIVIDDGSTDDTKKLALEKGVKVISHDYNLVYGASIKTGVRHVVHETILITDADGTYPADHIPQILSHIPNYEMVVGARTGKNVHIPWLRKPAKWMLSKLANYLTGAKIIDLNSGLRAIQKKRFNEYAHILPDGFSLTTTITCAMHTNHLQIKYIPINYLPREGKSKIKPIRDTLNFFSLIIRTVLLFNPLKIFLPISLVMSMVAFFVYFYSLFYLSYTLDITAVVLLMSGMQILAIGLLADLINKRMR